MDPEEGRAAGHPEVRLPLDDDLRRIGEKLTELGQAQEKLQILLTAMLALSRETELSVLLRRIVTSAMALVRARYGAMGVLGEDGEWLSRFIPEGLNSEELADLEGVELPRGRGLLGKLIQDPEPLRVQDIAGHPAAAGFPPGHPPMKTLLGVAVIVQGRVYGNLYLSERLDGQPFDSHDEDVVVALAGAAAVAIEKASLYERVRSEAERFQRLLLPQLPDPWPLTAAAVYRPAAKPNHLGGDWYDVLVLPDGICAAVIGDVSGHDLTAAAAMSQTRNMLRALLCTQPASPSAVLTQLDFTLKTVSADLVTTVLVALIEPHGDAWTVRWSSAGHPPPLLLAPGEPARYLDIEPCLPLGVEPDRPRHDRTHVLPAGATVVFFTDGLIEHHHMPIDAGLRTLADLASAHAALPVDELCRLLADDHPSDGRDDLAVLVVRTPPAAHEG
ncbi:GAF domain-containing SpoIIE family protein phosphatase [Streptomyces sp. AK02-01A]|uniref:PP2C family protein-serine/threonine phosphatase n=1 Tax=Streptomyces sp. AK02-01A TaxID=3028648 RepID=UPI0029A5E1C5|nr:GAF domain-containing SpoIIE family protein phosphatase [Streptomyces sp. AK02-01A]MDX3852384.1 SpoIIE family protein phosphatase [Streptomyces sp. AK02-01A]